ncbi:hypothetical protein Tco_1308958, partial [Tanacetum coccineum]
VYRPKNRQEHRSGNRKSLQQSSILRSLATWGKDDGATSNINIKQYLRKVTDEHFTAAVKVLSSFSVAPYSDDTIKALEAKHPYKSPSSMPNITFSEPPLVAEIDSVFGYIKSFLQGSLCGRDGLRTQHILDALCEEGSATAMNILKVITSVINSWLAGRCLPILAEFVASILLTPLLKPDNGIRPILVGTIWRHLVSKVAMKDVGKEMSKSLVMLTMEFLNALNLVHRSTLFHKVKQGDPLGPLLFAFILHPLLYKIKDRCKLLLHAWYRPLLEIQKRSSSGVKLLGGAVSRDVNFINGLAMRRATNAVDLMSLLPQLACQLVHMEEATLVFDKGLSGSIENIVDTLSKAQQTLANVLFSEMVKDMEVHFDMTMRQKAVFECLRALNAQDFLLAILMDGPG